MIEIARLQNRQTYFITYVQSLLLVFEVVLLGLMSVNQSQDKKFSAHSTNYLTGMM